MEIANILAQYCELREEIKDLTYRINTVQNKLDKMEKEGCYITDCVSKGKKGKKSLGSIQISGFPLPEYNGMRSMMKKRIAKLKIMEDDLLEALNAVDDYIAQIPQSELRMIFRLYYLDDLTWFQVALKMNERFPKRRTKYTDESCRKKHDRYIEKI